MEKHKLKKQKVLLLNLSSAEILNILYMIAYICVSGMDLTAYTLTILNNVLIASFHIVTTLFYNAMIVIAWDRLVSTIFPTGYYVYVRNTTLQKIVLFSWVFSIIFLIICVCLPISMEMYAHVILVCSYVSQVLFLALSVTAYTLIGLSHFRRQSLGVQQNRLFKRKGFRRTLAISFSLTITFVIFSN